MSKLPCNILKIFLGENAPPPGCAPDWIRLYQHPNHRKLSEKFLKNAKSKNLLKIKIPKYKLTGGAQQNSLGCLYHCIRCGATTKFNV